MTSSAAQSERPAIAALLVGAIGIAFAPIFVRWSEVGPTSTAFWRLALAVPFLWLWALQARRKDTHVAPRPGDLRYLVLPGLFFAADLGVWHWSIKFTTVANSTLLANFSPVFVTLGGFLVFRRRFRPLFYLGLVLAVAGAVVLLGDSVHLGRENVLGDALGLLTAVFYASYILSVGKLRERFSTPTIMAWAVTVAAVVILPVCFVSGEVFWPATGRAWIVLLGLALVSQVVGQGLIAFALAHLPAAFSAVTLLLQPVTAALLAWYFFAEALGRWQALGGGVVLAGIVIARVASRRGRA